MTKRQTNYELLRIISMCMVITLHYLDKGKILPELLGQMNIAGVLAWLLEAFCLVAVNVYVLISGYFLSQSEFHMQKLVRLWKQIFFYALVIGILALTLGLTHPEEMNIYRMVYYFFPAVTNHYWFATSYLLLYVLVPFLNKGIQSMDKEKFGRLLGILLLFFSVAKTVIPASLPYDDGGYNVLWFICLYLTGAYLKRFGSELFFHKKKSMGLYLGSVSGIFLLTFALRAVFLQTGHLQDLVGYAYTYNHVLCFLGAVGLFTFFQRVRVPQGRISDGIIKLSSATFGVYLIHEHVELRYVWPQWLHTEAVAGSLLWIPHWIFSVIVLYLICSCIELLRQKLFVWMKL
ncbi:MAG: acyltransferase [Lachnospiraceae bacterium]|nr:acyltransferase [Lachnospiraceae bacterium]